MNIVHEIDPAIVSEQIRKACKKYAILCDERVMEAKESQVRYAEDLITFCRKPDTPEVVKAIWDGAITRQIDYYSLVRVVELPLGEKRFKLVYGDTDNQTVTEGTGPFESIEEAVAWFTTGGR